MYWYRDRNQTVADVGVSKAQPPRKKIKVYYPKDDDEDKRNKKIQEENTKTLSSKGVPEQTRWYTGKLEVDSVIGKKKEIKKLPTMAEHLKGFEPYEDEFLYPGIPNEELYPRIPGKRNQRPKTYEDEFMYPGIPSKKNETPKTYFNESAHPEYYKFAYDPTNYYKHNDPQAQARIRDTQQRMMALSDDDLIGNYYTQTGEDPRSRSVSYLEHYTEQQVRDWIDSQKNPMAAAMLVDELYRRWYEPKHEANRAYHELESSAKIRMGNPNVSPRFYMQPDVDSAVGAHLGLSKYYEDQGITPKLANYDLETYFGSRAVYDTSLRNQNKEPTPTLTSIMHEESILKSAMEEQHAKIEADALRYNQALAYGFLPAETGANGQKIIKPGTAEWFAKGVASGDIYDAIANPDANFGNFALPAQTKYVYTKLPFMEGPGLVNAEVYYRSQPRYIPRKLPWEYGPDHPFPDYNQNYFENDPFGLRAMFDGPDIASPMAYMADPTRRFDYLPAITPELVTPEEEEMPEEEVIWYGGGGGGGGGGGYAYTGNTSPFYYSNPPGGGSGGGYGYGARGYGYTGQYSNPANYYNNQFRERKGQHFSELARWVI